MIDLAGSANKARTGLDLVAMWESGVVERLSSRLLCTRIHLQPLGRDTLAAAEAVAGLMIGSTLRSCPACFNCYQEP